MCALVQGTVGVARAGDLLRVRSLLLCHYLCIDLMSRVVSWGGEYIVRLSVMPMNYACVIFCWW